MYNLTFMATGFDISKPKITDDHSSEEDTD